MMNLSLKTRELLTFIILSFLLYSVIILVFAGLYYNTGSIALTPYSRPFTEQVDFSKAIYFSIVSFHTIGFGDIHPITQTGRNLVMVQSIFSLFFTSIFSGFLVFFVIKRPNDLFCTRHLYIRQRNERYWLSVRFGNKGRTIIGLQGRFEAWTIENNTRVRAFQWGQDLPDLERILYVDIPFDERHKKLKQAIVGSIEENRMLHMKFSIIGNDIKSGEQVAFMKYFDSHDLRFGTIFHNVYSWDENGRRKDFRWKNFEKIDVMSEEHKRLFLEK
ncbi:MAG: potassium channel family protein [Syntrophothermus sp.]